MTDPVVTLTPEQVSVPANGQVGVVVTVRNVSAVVEGYRLDLVAQDPTDGPAVWGEVQPPELRVYPNEQATATVVFAPPAGSLASSGRFAFGVRVRSVVDPDASSVVEGDVEVGQVLGLQAKLTPVTSTGRWRGRHVVRYTNWGNTSTRLHVIATDPDDRLGFLPAEADLDLPLGATATLKLRVRARKPFLRGTPARLPFQVIAEPVGAGPAAGGPPRPVVPGDPSRPVVDGALTQKPILTRMTVAVAVLAVAALVGAGAYVWKKPAPLKTYETEGPPSAPVPTAAARPDGTIQVSWGAVDQIEKYKLVTLQGGVAIGVTDIPAEQQAYVSPALTPSTEYCFQVLSVRGSLESPRSKPVCATTPAPVAPTSSTSPSPSGGSSAGGATSPGAGSSTPGGGVVVVPTGPGGSGSPTPSADPSQVAARPPGADYSNGHWAVLLSTVPGAVDDPTAKATAQTKFAQFAQQSGQTVFLVHTTWYPAMTINGLPVKPAWLVISGPLDSYQSASGWCTAVGISQQCQAFLPGD